MGTSQTMTARTTVLRWAAAEVCHEARLIIRVKARTQMFREAVSLGSEMG